MRFFSGMALAATLLVCAASVASADQLKTDYDHGVNFSKYHTYSWGKVTTTNPFYVERVKRAVDQSLQARGWRMVPSGGETTIFAHDRVHNEQELETMYDGMGGWGGGWGWGRWGGMGGMGESTTDTVDMRVGRLVIDIFDTQSKALLWRGSTTEDLSNNSDKNSRKLAGDIAKLFREFPPGKK